MPIDHGRTLRGALAGVAAAGVWAAQMPIDKRLFRSPHDDIELLGKLIVRRGRGWRAAGVAWHLGNGALFGAAYANLAPSMPLPSWARAPFASMFENVASLPLAAAAEAASPVPHSPPLRSPRAIGQAVWRHLVFGVVLGELERRLNPPARDEPAPRPTVLSANGHGNIEHAGTAIGLR